MHGNQRLVAFLTPVDYWLHLPRLGVGVRQALVPDLPEFSSPWRRIACLCLYIRSHWLRMPPLPLALHLMRKAWLRSFAAAP